MSSTFNIIPSDPRLRVTVAPGQCVRLSPHPSGIPELPPLSLYGGESFTTTEAEALRLYYLGKVLHPVRGRPRPSPPVQNEGVVTVTLADRTMPMSDPSAAMAIAAAERQIAHDRQEAFYAEQAAERAEMLRGHSASGPSREPRVTITDTGDVRPAMVTYS